MDRTRGLRVYDYRGSTDDIIAAAHALNEAVQAQAPAAPSILIGHDGSADAMEVAGFFTGPSQALTAPAVYQLSRGYTLGVMVTGSHSSRQGHTGLKVAQNGQPWATTNYAQWAETGQLPAPLRVPAPGLRRRDELHAYRRLINAGIGGVYLKWDRPLHVMAGSPVVTQLAVEVLSDVGLQVSGETVPGLDPSVPFETRVAEDVVLFDADGDRGGLIWRGRWRSPTELTLADLHLLATSTDPGGSHLLFDLRTPRAVWQTARAEGFPCHLTPGGRWCNLVLMHERQYVYAAEVSGHRYWAGFSGHDCAIFAMLRTMQSYFGHDPAEPLAEPIITERRGVSAQQVAMVRAEIPKEWAVYETGEGREAAWRAEPPDEDGWICGRLTSEGTYSLGAEGSGELLLDATVMRLERGG